mmetsp:Transcript_27654/g.83406  ORF Transcript_27654/g.83406 Transcript_27654/m.83406 type:complete len:250 (-) Transcript_27654:241-990(-)
MGVAQVAVKRFGRAQDWASTPVGLATPHLLPVGPRHLPVRISGLAIEQRARCRVRATVANIVAAPRLLRHGPAVSPIRQLSLAVEPQGPPVRRRRGARRATDPHVVAAPDLLLGGPRGHGGRDCLGGRMRVARSHAASGATPRERRPGREVLDNAIEFGRPEQHRRARVRGHVRVPSKHARGWCDNLHRLVKGDGEADGDQHNDPEGAAAPPSADAAIVRLGRGVDQIIIPAVLADEGVLVGLHVIAFP